MKCQLCQEQIDPAWDYQEITGYEPITPSASSKGKSVSAQRRVPDRYACRTCVKDLREGRTPGQTAML